MTFETGRLPAGRPEHHARRHRHQRPAASGPIRADPGRFHRRRHARLQIAKLKGAGLVIGTSTNEDKSRRLKEFGADLVLDSRDPKWADEVVKATGGGSM